MPHFGCRLFNEEESVDDVRCRFSIERVDTVPGTSHAAESLGCNIYASEAEDIIFREKLGQKV